MKLRVTLIELLVPILIIAITAGLVAGALTRVGCHGALAFPVGILAGCAVLYALYRLASTIEARFDNREGRCPQCRHDLHFDFESGCPECGWNRENKRINDESENEDTAE